MAHELLHFMSDLLRNAANEQTTFTTDPRAYINDARHNLSNDAKRALMSRDPDELGKVIADELKKADVKPMW